jgi:TetR/AcrR family transcriptional regulator, regulator of cefoperazone and chloramphenicol sensitivity
MLNRHLTDADHEFYYLNMCAALEDLTAAARIREAAMGLFAERGPAAVTIRDIAAAAGVSPSLVIHHYGSKEGLKAAVDKRAMALVEDLLAEFTVSSPESGSADSLAAMMYERLEREPALIAYMRRLFVDGGPQAEALFRTLFDVTLSSFEQLEAAGLMRPAVDARARAAFLLANDLGAMLLREPIAAVLGFDPLTRSGMQIWTAQLLDVYTRGVFTMGKNMTSPGSPEVDAQ